MSVGEAEVTFELSMVAADGFGAVLRCPLRPVPDLTLRVFFCCCFLLALGLPARCLPALTVLREAVFFPLRFIRTSPEIAPVTPCRNPVINAFMPPSPQKIGMN